MEIHFESDLSGVENVDVRLCRRNNRRALYWIYNGAVQENNIKYQVILIYIKRMHYVNI